LVAKAVTTGKVRVHEVRVSGENLFEAAQFAIEKKSDCFAPFPKFLDVEEVEYTVDLGAGPAGVDAGIALDHAISKGSRGAVLLRVVQEGKADADRCEYVLAQVTDLGITAVASGRDVVAMVTRLADGVAVRGAEVRLEDPAAPGPVITSVTDESGVARLSLAPGTTTPQGLFIAAAFGTDIAVLPIDAPLATDLPPDCPVPSRSLTREYPELVAGEGSLGGGPGMAAGEGEGAGTSTGPIAVEVELVPVSVRSPKARVLGTCDSHPLLVGQEVVAKVRGYRKLDEPADYAAVAWRLTRRATARFGESLLAGTDLLFTDVDSRCAELARGPEEVAAGTGFLDGRGTLRVPLKLDVGARASCGSITFVFEATVTDLGSGPVAATAEVVAHAGERYAGVRVDALGALAGEDIVAEASLVGLSGAPLVFGDVTLTLWKQVPRTTGEPMGISVESCTSTSARLPVRCTFTLPEPGKYVVRSTTWDATGRPTRAAVEVASFGDGAALGVAPGTLLMVPEHGSYAPGETARVRLQAPFAEGAGMALALSGGVRHVLTFALSGGTSTIAFPVDPDMLNCPRVLALALPTMDSDVSRFVDTRTAVALGSLRVPVSTDFPPIQAGQSGRFGAPDGADEVCGQRLEMVFVAESRWEGEAYPASPSSPPVRLAGLPPEGGDEQGLATRPILPGEGGDGAHPASPSSPPIRPAGLPPEGGDEQGLATRPILPGGTGAARAFSVETVLACLVEEAALDRGPLDAQYDLLSRFQRPDGAFDLWPGFSSPDPVIAALVGVLAGGCGECEGRGVRYDRLAGYLRAVATFALAQDREDGSPLWETYGDLAIAVAGHALVDARRGELTSERLAQACAFLAPPDADSARKTAGHSPGAPKTGGDVASGPPKTAGNVASAPRKAPGTRRGAGKVVQQAPVLAQVWMLEAATLVLGKAARPEATGELSAASECADRMLAQIRKAAREQRGSAHILDRAPGTSPLSLSQAGRDAAVLRVLLATNPGEPLVDKIAKGLLDAQRDGRWGDHLADAVAVDALSAYYRTREQRSELVELAARSRLRCEPSHPAAPATAALPHADAKASGTAGGAAAKADAKASGTAGGAAAKADAKASGTAGGAAAKAEDAGFGVEREVRCTGGVLAPYGPDTDSRSAGKGPRRNNRTNGGRRSALPARSDDEAYQGYVVGDPVEVVVRVRTRADRNLVVVEIPLPAGFGLDDSAPGPGDWSYAEVYDDRVVLYFDEMAAGTYEFTFGATATAAGEFYWPPVTAEEMRKPGAHGRSKATAVILGARGHCQRMIR